MSIKVRIAPSPTGNLHIGTARTALFNWLFARRHGGQFAMRIEDTDLERSDKKYEESIIRGLKWLGIEWSGEITRQSERLKVYRGYLEQMLTAGKAFWCHHTKEELEKERKSQESKKEAPRHLCEHKNESKGKAKGEIIRLNVPWESEKQIKFTDLIRGEIIWDERLLGDLSLAKDLDTPLYNFAVVADDIDMDITHVIRGEDHISNTPKQLLIYSALGKPSPQFGHLPLILGADRSKLSKRHGATDLIEYQKDYLPEAMINFMGFLGYTYSKEILSMEEMAQEFDIAKVHKSGAIFDVKKLNWLNAQYIKQLPAGKLRELTGLHELSNEAEKIISERIDKLSQVGDDFNIQQDYPPELLNWKGVESATTRLAIGAMEVAVGSGSVTVLKEKLEELAEKYGSRGAVYWPLRVALSGKEKSAGPLELYQILGPKKAIEAVKNAVKKLEI